MTPDTEVASSSSNKKSGSITCEAPTHTGCHCDADFFTAQVIGPMLVDGPPASTCPNQDVIDKVVPIQLPDKVVSCCLPFLVIGIERATRKEDRYRRPLACVLIQQRCRSRITP